MRKLEAKKWGRSRACSCVSGMQMSEHGLRTPHVCTMRSSYSMHSMQGTPSKSSTNEENGLHGEEHPSKATQERRLFYSRIRRSEGKDGPVPLGSQ